MDNYFKEIKSLEKFGYYIINAQNNINIEHDLIANKKLLLYFCSTNSTMDTAKLLAESGCQNKSLVITEKQQAGRGRLNRSWLSSTGGLYFTMILKPDIPIEKIFGINFLVSISLEKTLSKYYGIKASLKWPNDVLVDNKKIAGCLIQTQIHFENILYVNIGVGVNINNTIESDEFLAISLKQLLNKNTGRVEFLKYFLNEFDDGLNNFNISSILSKWKQVNSTIGKFVEVKTINNSYKGKALDIDNNGSLIIELSNGDKELIVFGDCFYL